MSVTRIPYSGDKIAQLKQLLVNNAQSGNPKDYEIKVDEMKVVSRTNNPEQFDTHEDFIDENTSSVTITLFEGASRNNTKHIFLLKDKKPEEVNPPLSGVDIAKKVDEKVEEIKKQIKYDQIQKENGDLKEELGEVYEALEKLKTSYSDLKNNKGEAQVNWGKVAGGVIEGLLRKNVHLLANIPGGQELAGMWAKDEKDTKEIGAAETGQGEASFQKKPSDEVTLTQEQKAYMKVLKWLEENFDEPELDNVMNILNLLAEKPKALEPTKCFVQEWGLKKSEKPVSTQEPKKEEQKEGGEKRQGYTQYEEDLENEGMPETSISCA